MITFSVSFQPFEVSFGSFTLHSNLEKNEILKLFSWTRYKIAPVSSEWGRECFRSWDCGSGLKTLYIWFGPSEDISLDIRITPQRIHTMATAVTWEFLTNRPHLGIAFVVSSTSHSRHKESLSMSSEILWANTCPAFNLKHFSISWQKSIHPGIWQWLLVTGSIDKLWPICARSHNTQHYSNNLLTAHHNGQLFDNILVKHYNCQAQGRVS